MMSMLAVISGSALVNLIVWLVVAGLIFWIVSWGLDKISIPEPFNKVCRVILILFIVLAVVNALLSLTSHGGFVRF